MPQETHVPLGTADPGRWAAAIGKALKATNEPADASASALRRQPQGRTRGRVRHDVKLAVLSPYCV